MPFSVLLYGPDWRPSNDPFTMECENQSDGAFEMPGMCFHRDGASFPGGRRRSRSVRPCLGGG